MSAVPLPVLSASVKEEEYEASTDDDEESKPVANRAPSPVMSAPVKSEEIDTDDDGKSTNEKSRKSTPTAAVKKRIRSERQNHLMIWARRDSDTIDGEKYRAYLDKEANNEEKQGSDYSWIRWDSNIGTKIRIHNSRIVSELAPRGEWNDDSAKKSKLGDRRTVLAFFKKLIPLIERDEKFYSCRKHGTHILGEKMVNMIKSSPSLLQAVCPRGKGREIFQGLTAAECCCATTNRHYYSESLLAKLVKLGAKATDRCYQDTMGESSKSVKSMYVKNLLLSGYFPQNMNILTSNGSSAQSLSQGFTLDYVAEFLTEMPRWCPAKMFILVILHKLVVPGYIYPWSYWPDEMDLLYSNNKHLPILSTRGDRTHLTDGPMDKLMKQYSEDFIEQAWREECNYYLARWG